ncbi:MAG TPA: hypothetical protein ENG40_02270 [Thermoprotei archaeon]|nr:hypothetical protein [Thermoprotei archaeon]
MCAEEVWNYIKDRVSIDREEFFKMVSEIREKAKFINEKGAAIIAAEKLGIMADEILFPPIIGRVLEIGPVKRTRSGVPYRMFWIVNSSGIKSCVAFGDQHVNFLEDLEDKLIKISKYVVAKTTFGPLTRVTEISKIEVLDDDLYIPITDIDKAYVNSIAELKKSRISKLCKAVVIFDQVTELSVCPICGLAVSPSNGDWVCSTHGLVDPELRKVHRLQVSDESGIYSATFYGEVEELKNKLIVFKATFRGEELYILKIYSVQNIFE